MTFIPHFVNVKVKVKSLSRARLFVTPWIVACTKLLHPWDFQGTSVLEWVAISFSRESSQPRDWTQVSHIVDRCFTVWATREVDLCMLSYPCNPGMGPIWLQYMIHLLYCWIQFASFFFVFFFFLRIFAIYVHQYFGLWFSFLVVSLPDFGIRVLLAL